MTQVGATCAYNLQKRDEILPCKAEFEARKVGERAQRLNDWHGFIPLRLYFILGSKIQTQNLQFGAPSNDGWNEFVIWHTAICQPVLYIQFFEAAVQYAVKECGDIGKVESFV